MRHLDEGIIHAWIDGELPPDEAARVEAHAKACASCGPMVAEARGLVAASSRIVSALDSLPRAQRGVTPGGVLPAFGARKAPRRWSTRHVGSAIAATLVIAAGMLITVRGKLETPAPVADRVAETAVPGVRPASNPPTAALERPTVPTAAGQRVADRQASPQSVALRENRVAGAPAASSTPPGATPAPAPALGALVERMERMTVAGAVPAAQIDSVQLTRASVMMKKVAAAASGGAAGAGGIARARSATGSAAPERAFFSAADAASAPSFIGCYELNESTDVLPKRFALRTDSVRSGPDPLYEVRYVDSTGVVDGRIPDVGWLETGGRVVIRTAGRGEVLTILRAGNAVAAQSPLGPRTVRVTPCR